MKLADLSWEQLEPMLDAGMYVMATCPECGEYQLVNCKQPEPGGPWEASTVCHRRDVSAQQVSVVRKDVAQAVGYEPSTYRLD